MAFFLPLLVSLLTLLPATTSAQLQCEGDVDGDNMVSVDELIMAVDNSLHGCTPVDPRFVDNGDGTISDNLTGLMWEKKVEGEGCLHCVGDLYTWFVAMSDWLSSINGAFEGGVSGLGGFDDWRMPSIEDLQTILDCSFGIPCLDPIVGPSSTSCYWTSISDSNSPHIALTIDFGGAGLVGFGKTGPSHARAVRGVLRR